MPDTKKLDCNWPATRLEPRRLRVKDDYLQRVLDGEEFLVFDGAMGTQLQARGLAAGELPELLCLTNPDEIRDIHAAYVAAGADVATTNTFGANREKLGDAATVEEIFDAAITCARESGVRYVAADIGPTGQLLEPMGTLPFDDAYELFAEQARAATAAGACEASVVAAAHEAGLYTNFRFSPGYGDMPLQTQSVLLAALDAQRKLGITLSKSLLMTPTKSVTAVIGLFDEPQPSSHATCKDCLCSDFCHIRATGRPCWA